MASLDFYGVESVKQASNSFNEWHNVICQTNNINNYDPFSAPSLGICSNSYFSSIFGNKAPTYEEIDQILIVCDNWRASAQETNDNLGINAANAFQDAVIAYEYLHLSFDTEGVNVDDAAMHFDRAIKYAAEMYAEWLYIFG